MVASMSGRSTLEITGLPGHVRLIEGLDITPAFRIGCELLALKKSQLFEATGSLFDLIPCFAKRWEAEVVLDAVAPTSPNLLADAIALPQLYLLV